MDSNLQGFYNLVGLNSIFSFNLNFNTMNATELFFQTIQQGNVENIKLQIENKPEVVNAKDARGFTPLIFATYFGQDAIAKILVENRAKIEAKDASGNTALMGVCFKGNIDMAAFLISKGANVDTTNANGTTPLIFSAMYGQADSVKLLSKHGADKTLKDQAGKTALDYAKEKGFKAIIEVLT